MFSHQQLEELEKGAREDLGERLRETSLRLRETERQLAAVKKDNANFQDMLHQTQVRSITPCRYLILSLVPQSMQAQIRLVCSF